MKTHIEQAKTVLLNVVQRIVMRQAAAAPRPLISTKPEAQQAKPAGGLQWHPMPGQRLELGATGFYIAFAEVQTSDGKLMGFQAFNPEGVRMAWTLVELPGLKKLCEEQARYREEFQP